MRRRELRVCVFLLDFGSKIESQKSVSNGIKWEISIIMFKKESYRRLMLASVVLAILSLVGLANAKEQFSMIPAPPKRLLVEIRQLLSEMHEIRGEIKPDISADVRDYLVSLQPDAGNALLTVIANSIDNLNRRATNTLLQIWEHLTWEQINAYLQHSMECYIRYRSQYPQGFRAYIGTGYCVRYSWGGWPRDKNFKVRTVSSRYLDDKLWGQPFHYEGPGASSGDIRLDSLDLGQHSVYVVTQYEGQYKGWKFTGNVRSEKYYFQIVRADTPDHLAAPRDPELDRLVHESLHIMEAEEPIIINRAPSLWEPDPWEPQITWEKPDGTESDIHVPVWKLTRQLPVDLCFDVEFHLEETGEVYKGDPMVVLKGSKHSGYFSMHYVTEFASGRDGFIPVRIILKPSRATALSHTTVTQYYTGSITSDVVRVKVNHYPAQAKQLWLRQMQLQFEALKRESATDPTVLCIIEGLVSTNPRKRFETARSLTSSEKHKLTPAIPFLIQLLGDNKGSFPGRSPVHAALFVLKRIGKPAVEPLIASLNEENANIRASSAMALGLIADTRATNPLIAALSDKESLVRGCVAQALGNVADLHALEPLINALEDNDEEVRQVAASALGELRNQRAVNPLIMALKDRSHYVRASAAKALKKITGKDFGQDMDKWQQWWHRQAQGNISY